MRGVRVKFSIVTISFNQAEFLERTILSVLNQTGVDLEYIVVDPGSTDGSRDIIERYRDRISHIAYEKDEGPADGLNKGFALATGDVYGYLNSDDTLEPAALSKVKAYLEAHPTVDVVSGHGWVTDRDDRRLRRIWSEPFRKLFVAYGAAILVQPSTFFRKTAYLKTDGFNPSNRGTWDGELWVDMFLAGARFGLLNARLSCYRLHSVSITNSGSLAHLIKHWHEERFARLLGRPLQRGDTVIARVFQALKHARHPLSTWERIRKGPVFRRGVE
jgi:glycosyltransferase involved in cell wall biosynthesis